MSARTFLVSVGLFAVVCGAHAQPLQFPGAPPTPVYPPPPAVAPQPVPSVPSVPHERSVDDLLGELEGLRAQKAALEKKEQELTATLRKKLDAQAERLKKLGVAPNEAKPAEPDRVGKILLEGHDKKDEKKILDALGFAPGQILQYPKVEDARMRLIKAGFADVAVEVTLNELDASYKDIRVKIVSPKR